MPQRGRRTEMIDHVYISVTDVERSLVFYPVALKPLGWSRFGNYDASSGPESVPDLYGLDDDTYVSCTGVGSSIWLRQRKPGETVLYLGIVCDSNEAVDAAYAAAIKGGSPTASRPIGPASRLATAPPTSPTSTATAWNSYTRPGTPSPSALPAPGAPKRDLQDHPGGARPRRRGR